MCTLKDLPLKIYRLRLDQRNKWHISREFFVQSNHKKLLGQYKAYETTNVFHVFQKPVFLDPKNYTFSYVIKNINHKRFFSLVKL